MASKAYKLVILMFQALCGSCIEFALIRISLVLQPEVFIQLAFPAIELREIRAKGFLHRSEVGHESCCRYDIWL